MDGCETGLEVERDRVRDWRAGGGRPPRIEDGAVPGANRLVSLLSSLFLFFLEMHPAASPSYVSADGCCRELLVLSSSGERRQALGTENGEGRAMHRSEIGQTGPATTPCSLKRRQVRLFMPEKERTEQY